MFRFLCSLAFLSVIMIAGCSKDAPETCITVPAAQGITFRLVDSAGADVLKGGQANVVIEQPCRTVPLVPDFKVYPVPGTNDSATILGFGNLETPEYGTGLAECYRIYFKFPDGNIDTVDWHYRIDQNGDCKRQTIDYMTYNGQNALQETAFGRTYYRIKKS